MANNPRHQLPMNRNWLNKVTFYGDKLEDSVKKGQMADSTASMTLSQYVEGLRSAEQMETFMMYNMLYQ